MSITRISTTNFVPTHLPTRVSAEKVNEIIDTLNLITSNGTALTTVAPAAASLGITIDAATIVHTGVAAISINSSVDVSNGSNRYASIQNTIAVGVALGAGEEVEGKYLTIAGLAADADTSAINGIKMALNEVTTGRADVTGIYCTISSVRDNADTDTVIYGTFTGTMNHASAITYGINFTTSSLTHTSGTFYGFSISTPHTVTAGNVYGGYIATSGTAKANAKYGLYLQKNLTNNAASGALTQTNSALYVTQASATSAAASGATTTANDVAYIEMNNTTSIASADVYSGKALEVAYSVTTTGAGTATNSGSGLLVNYDITGTAGTLSNTAFNVAYIDVDVTTSASFANGAYNMLAINYSTNGISPAYAATCTVSGINIDLSGAVMSDADLVLYGISIALPAQSTAHCADIRLSGAVSIYSGIAVTRAAVRALVGDAASQGSLFIAQASVATTKPNCYIKVLNASANTDWERIVTAATD